MESIIFQSKVYELCNKQQGAYIVQYCMNGQAVDIDRHMIHGYETTATVVILLSYNRHGYLSCP